MASRKATLRIERPEKLTTLCVRVSSDDRRLIAALEVALDGRSAGEVVRHAIRKLAEAAGVR